jgi:hypothetical protein
MLLNRASTTGKSSELAIEYRYGWTFWVLLKVLSWWTVIPIEIQRSPEWPFSHLTVYLMPLLLEISMISFINSPKDFRTSHVVDLHRHKTPANSPVFALYLNLPDSVLRDWLLNLH